MSEAAREPTPDLLADRPRVGRLHLALLTAGIVLYAFTAQRGPGWQDSGIFQLRIARFDLAGWLGVALAHPVMVLLGNAFRHLPFGTPAWRINLVSAVFGALAAANIGAMVFRLAPNRRAPALLAAGMFGLGHAVWWLSTICESQPIYAAIFTLELHVLVTLVRRPAVRWAALLGLVSGLGLATHNLALLALPAHGLVVLYLVYRRRMPAGAVPAMIGAWLVGSSLWWMLVFTRAGETGLADAIRSGLFGDLAQWQSDVLVGRVRALIMGAAAVGLQFPNLTLPLAAVGLVTLRKQVGAVLASAMGYLLAIHLLFAMRYSIADQFMFFLEAHAMIAILAGLGLARLTRDGRRRWLTVAAAVALAVTPAIYASLPTLWSRAGLGAPGRADLPFRRPARYWFVPWKHNEHSAERFARGVLADLPPDSHLIIDSTAKYPVRWMQEVHGLRPDVRLYWEDLTRQVPRASLPVGTRSVYTASADPAYLPKRLLEEAVLVRDDPGDLVWRVVWLSPPGPTPSPPGRRDRPAEPAGATMSPGEARRFPAKGTVGGRGPHQCSRCDG